VALLRGVCWRLDLPGNRALVRGDRHAARAYALAVCHILQGGGGDGSDHVFEALNCSHFGGGNSGEFIAPGYIHRSSVGSDKLSIGIID
jgi:hypothetical protein